MQDCSIYISAESAKMQTSPSRVPVLHTPCWMNHDTHPCHHPSPNPFHQRQLRGTGCSLQHMPFADTCKVHRQARKRDQSCMGTQVAYQPADVRSELSSVAEDNLLCCERSSPDHRREPKHVTHSCSTNAEALGHESTIRLAQTKLLQSLGVIKIEEANICEYFLGVLDILMMLGDSDAPSLASVPSEPGLTQHDYPAAELETDRSLYDIYHLLNERL
ncbi:hypothetical protein BJX65DRAFT_276649 [Aspergillus insuetus]